MYNNICNLNIALFRSVTIATIMRPAVFVIVLALALTSFALGSNASPMPTGVERDRAKMILDNLSQVMKQSSDALAQVQQSTKRLMQTHGAPVGSFSTERPNRKLQQDVQPCPGSSTAACTTPSQAVSACFLAVFNQPNMDSMGSLFGLPTFLCQLSTSNSSCAATLINYVKTCTCIDYQPIFNLVCPTAPSASACSKNTYVQQFIALQTNSSFGFFGNAAMNMGVLFDGFGKQPDLTMCGDPEVYRTTMLINNIGACLYDIVNAFPMPSFTTPPGGINYRQMMTGSLKCALTMPSYRLQSLCSGNVAKCYSALQAPSSNLGSCGTLSAGTCPAGCSAQLATFGATASTSPASCCVKWFQNMAGAPSCSTTPSLTMSNMMGPECTDFMNLASSACQPSAGNTCPTPAMLSQYMNFPMFPAACSAKTPPSLAVAACAVSAMGLTAACADSSTPYVQSSLFAPLKTTTATLSFTSAGLSAVRILFALSICLCPCASQRCRSSSKSMRKR